MLYLLLTIACMLGIAMLFKYSEMQGYDRMGLLTANYLVAWGVSQLRLYVVETSLWPSPSPELLLMGLLVGVLFIAGFFVLSWATRLAGMSLAMGVMRVSVVLPFLASWLLWKETPTFYQILGMVLAIMAFFLLSQHPETETSTTRRRNQVFLVLALLFLSGGLVDISMKAFDEYFALRYDRAFFASLAFGMAFLCGAAIVLFRGLRYGKWPEPQALLLGIPLGLINYGSIEFMLLALKYLPGTLVFPLNSIGQVLGSALLGVVIWKERLNRANRWGLALASMALVLINL